MSKLTKQQWKMYYGLINDIIHKRINTPLLIVTENLDDIPHEILNHCNVIDNLENKKQ